MHIFLLFASISQSPIVPFPKMPIFQKLLTFIKNKGLFYMIDKNKMENNDA